MGFSVSGAAAIVLVGGLIAFGTLYTASANSFEYVAEAESDRTDRAIEQQNTAVEITDATYDGTADELTVLVENTGAAQLRLTSTDVLVDGHYATGWRTDATVAGYADTDLWLSGEQATVVVREASQPDRVKVVTAGGVAATAEVTST